MERQSNAKHFGPTAQSEPDFILRLLHMLVAFYKLSQLVQFTAGIWIDVNEYPSQRLRDLLFTPREGATTEGSSPGELNICCSALPGTSAPCGRESQVQWLGSLCSPFHSEGWKTLLTLSTKKKNLSFGTGEKKKHPNSFLPDESLVGLFLHSPHHQADLLNTIVDDKLPVSCSCCEMQCNLL